MATLNDIKAPIASDLAGFDNFIAEQFKAESPLLSQMLTYALSSRGKGVRPLVVMLSAALNSPAHIVSRRAWVAATMVEMIHLSSLIHDDVIDNSDSRRGKPSLNAMWQSRKSILVGDYILGRTLTLGMSSGQYDIVAHIAKSISILCEGEVIQDDFAAKHTMTREAYIDIIHKKTASLISISASAGALSAGASPSAVDKMRRFGEAIGMAFQIQDDILDYSPEAKTGKPSNGDLREGKVTLPLLYIIENSTEEQVAQITQLLSACKEDAAAIDTLQKMVEQGGGIEFATSVMRAYIDKATAILAQYEESEYRTALMNLCAFICEREA
ncbi:MAG: polyprenyl synthetase family protein [Rikenellaceae bacterium]